MCCFLVDSCFSDPSTVHHRGIRSSSVPAGVQPSLSASQDHQCTHGATQRQLWLGSKQWLLEEEEPSVTHHLLSASPQLSDGQHPQQAGAHAEPIRQRAAGAGAAGARSQPRPGRGPAQHEHHGQLLGPQQQHQAGARSFQLKMRLETRCRVRESDLQMQCWGRDAKWREYKCKQWKAVGFLHQIGKIP